MPSAKILEQKQAIVAALAEQMKNAGSGVLVDYQGITVEEDTALRAELRKNNVHYAVIKNTLASKACDIAGFTGLKDVLTGMTALASATIPSHRQKCSPSMRKSTKTLRSRAVLLTERS